MLESSIEKFLLNLCRKNDIFITKETGLNGIPDRLLLYDGRSWYVELKRPGKKPTDLQKAVAQKIRRHGGITLWASSYDDVIEIVNALTGHKDPPRRRYIPAPDEKLKQKQKEESENA